MNILTYLGLLTIVAGLFVILCVLADIYDYFVELRK